MHTDIWETEYLAQEKRVSDQRFKTNQNNRKCLQSITLLSGHLTERGLCIINAESALDTSEDSTIKKCWVVLTQIWVKYTHLKDY